MFNQKYLALSIAASFSAFSNVAFAEQNKEIETIEVTGRAQQFYLETESKIGTKTDLDLIKLPQSAQVLTEQLIIDQAARDITDLYRSIAG
ncbi:MAG TPA: TonB-dependent siderophore receptor, partial [Pseudoalteromonas sp.]|nr:TonB-dependent siderophore receptor [Pseudoalteromonas sp.]